MRRYLFAVLAAALVGMFVFPVAAGAGATKVDVCHAEGNGSYDLINISENAFDKHVEHGDASPGEAVPGMDGYNFGDDCVPVLSEIVFAIAFTDGDPTDGPGFKDGTDTLISKFIDGNGDGMPNADDLVVMGQPPLDLDATSFGTWGVSQHVVTTLTTLTNELVLVSAGSSTFRWFHTDDLERYFERVPTGAASTLSDRLTGSGAVLLRLNGNSPSQPSPDVSHLLEFREPGDEPFFDVEIYIAP